MTGTMERASMGAAVRAARQVKFPAPPSRRFSCSLAAMAKPPAVPLWARAFRGLLDASMSLDAWRPFEMGAVINFQKGGTMVFLGALMAYYRNHSPRACVYLALHGSYGLLWYLKDKAFPDPAWRRSVGPLGAIVMFAAVLGHYWAIGWMVMSGRAAPASALPVSEGALCAIAIILHTLGCGIMTAADAQKYFTLAAKKGLITNGMFAYVRAAS